MPFANTYAWPVTCGTVNRSGPEEAGIRLGRCVATRSAASVSVPPAISRPANVARTPRSRAAASSTISFPLIGLKLCELEPIVRLLGRGEDVEDARPDRRPGPRLGLVEPLEGRPREGLEPLLVLGVGRRRLQLQVEVRPGGVAGVADEPDGVACMQARARLHRGLE